MENETVDDSYKKGFEQGYWLQRGNRPDLVRDAMRSGPRLGGGYSSAMKAGKDEAVREMLRARLAEQERSQNRDKGMERE